MKKLIGKTDIEDSLQRLDKLTQQEVRIASAELLKSTRNVEETMTGIGDRVGDVSERLHEMDVRVQRVDDKLDQANSSSFPQLTTLRSEVLNISQGTNSAMISYDGFCHQIHPPIITLR